MGTDEGAKLLVWLVKELRRNGVRSVDLKVGGEIELKAMIEAESIATGLSEQEMRTLINDPHTPAERRAQLEAELERDLFASS